MQLTTQMVQPFISGQIEIQNEGEGYIYRGEIAEVVVEGDEFIVKCAWMAKGVGTIPAIGRWVKEDDLGYAANLTIYSVSDIGPGTEGSRRLCLQSLITGETVVLFPPDGSKFDRSKVEGLEPIPA